ncbi:zinc finger, CCHC-type containing protein [Tanacetum coccineum]
MFFYLTTLGLARFLKETVPQVEPPAEGQSSNAQAVQAVEAWKHSDFLCHNYVLNEFKNYLKHKRKEMSVEDLVVRLRIEEDNKLAQKDTYTPESAKANMVEHAGSSSRFNSKGNKKDKRKNDKKGKGESTNNSGWWIDTGATRHVCADKSMFHSFRAVDNGQKLYMGNSATADIKGEGDGYAVDAMFKLNCNRVSYEIRVKNDINKMNSSAYLIESSNVWHGRLGHGLRSSSSLDDKVVKIRAKENWYDLQDERQDQTDEEEVEPRRSKRARNEKSFGPDFVSFMVENEPTSYREAVTSSEGQQWREAIKVNRIYFTYTDVGARNLEIHQMDVKTAFLNGDLEEEIYMNQPEGFIAPGQEGKIGALRSPPRELRNEPNYVQNGVEMNEEYRD